ncbi:MAG: GTPase, partial [Thermotogota bacterium]
MPQTPKCEGCGVSLQSINAAGPGYVPLELFDKYENPLCQRCFRIRHYGSHYHVVSRYYTPQMVLDRLEKCGAVFYVTDLTDLTGTLNPDFLRRLPPRAMVLLNKFDLLPRYLTASAVKKKVSELYGIEKERLWPISTVNRYGIPGLKDLMLRDAENGFCGYVNAGKSSLINALLKNPLSEDNEELEKATTSPYPGTTYEPVTYDGGWARLVDVPGMENLSGICRWVDEKDRHLPGKTKRWHRKTCFIRQARAIFFSGLVKVEVEPEETVILQFYFGDNVSVHETNPARADEIYPRHCGALLLPPYSPHFEETWEWETRLVSIETGYDLCFSGLGWIYCSQGKAKMSVRFPEGLYIEKRTG